MRRSDLIIPGLCLLLLANACLLFAQPLHIPVTGPEQDKAFSEFNHHLAGVFLILIGFFAGLSRSSPKLSFTGLLWPFLFILPGIYLALMSDPDVWPMGSQSWAAAFRSNPEAAQHKLYALLLLSLGVIELLRARGTLPRVLSLWAFPVLAVAGAIMLFFHHHSSAMESMQPAMPGMQHGAHVMTGSMLKVRREHFWFSITGFCVVLAKFFSDAGIPRRRFVPFLWPFFIAVLGLLLILYRE